MSDVSWPCRVNFCSINDIKQLPRDGPSGLYPRRKKSNEYVKNILKLADAVEQKPWLMHKAGKELRDWVQEKHVRPPLFDSSFMLDCLKFQRSPAVHRMDFFVDQRGGQRAIGLEPVMAQIVTTKRNPRAAVASEPPRPTASAEFCYTTAAELVFEHGRSWAQAIALAEQCWSRLPKKSRKAVQLVTEVEEMSEDRSLEMPLRDL